eukprot:CAMPEP_0202458818 /NCGR_PEP_ID=MMETSP1360-20130828/28512_1 /ASSEMBLY_ACC=CAM_ASM_000848 /TAXON_ID=515479 /ORGANISM="Licmophora paradoxa, Strain CCMP2313" /LENGTH=69 /DNA_ID=CAMNT_0049079549 /DNA_START=60 /DNA_END=269 /DNA_ORIENTATION=+
MSGTKAATNFWRIAGMSYLQYVNKSASTMRACLKEPAMRKAMAQEKFTYNTSVWEGGVQGPKVPMTGGM